MGDEQQIISKEGFEKLQVELDELIKIKRPQIAKRIELAKDLGDLSENSEYHDAKEAMAFNDGRILDLTSMLKNLKIVENGIGNGAVGMGSTVIVKSKTGDKSFTIVSFNEADPLEGKISNESPLGKSFLKKKKGEKIIVTTPNGEVKYQILEIQ